MNYVNLTYNIFFFFDFLRFVFVFFENLKWIFVLLVCFVLWIVILNVFIVFSVFSVYRNIFQRYFSRCFEIFVKMFQKCEQFPYDSFCGDFLRLLVFMDPKWSPPPPSPASMSTFPSRRKNIENNLFFMICCDFCEKIDKVY